MPKHPDWTTAMTECHYCSPLLQERPHFCSINLLLGASLQHFFPLRTDLRSLYHLSEAREASWSHGAMLLSSSSFRGMDAIFSILTMSFRPLFVLNCKSLLFVHQGVSTSHVRVMCIVIWHALNHRFEASGAHNHRHRHRRSTVHHS